MNPIVDELVSKLPPDTMYPKELVVPIRPKIRGRSFFPGGCGLYEGSSQAMCRHPIVLVGQDFGNLEYWTDVAECEESRQGTWSGLQRLLSGANIDPRCCFFTNSLLGVRAHGPIDNPSPGLRCPRYVGACMDYLLQQLRTLQPSVVVGLGKVPSILIARLFGVAGTIPAPCEDDSRNANWNEIDRIVTPFQSTVNVPEVSPFAFATSVHPDRYWLNVGHRHWSSEGVRGKAAHDLVWSRVAYAHRAIHA